MITKQKLENHVKHLEEKLKRIRLDVDEAYMQGSDIEWEDLKKRKLKIKDEIEFCKKEMNKL